MPGGRVEFESLRGALTGNIVGRLVQMVALLLSAVVLARLLGPTGLGLVAIAAATVRLATIPVEEGAAKLCEREIAGAIGKSDRSQAIAALRFGAIATVAFGTMGALAVWGLGPIGLENGVLPAALALLWTNAVTATLRGVLRGEGQTTRAIAITNAQSFLAPLLCLLWAAGAGALTPAAALWLQSASKIALLPVLILFIRRYWRLVGDRTGGATTRSGWLGESLQFALLGLVTVALAELGTVMLGYLSTPEQAGLFRIASRAFLIAGFVALAAQQAYGPRIARDWQAGNRAALELPSRMMSIAALGGAVLALLGFALLGRWILVLAFGPAFEAAFLPALIMVAGAVSASFGALSPRLLKMTGEQRIVFRAALLALAIATALNLALIPHYGATGCAVASALAVTAGRVVMNHGVRRHLGFSAVPNRASARALLRRLVRQTSS
ncbi:MAG: Membrane protein involved in the export of O-antigen and teichoic acid [Rhodobacteraceae bacterium HLUCCO18]|nr:MAG: Membrane protein involved in the export of O-antigen and teichoic acid [Rhodobacteraceae bacterium HLUCCO18]